MKKLAIASASLALAAMPVVGVFAATDGTFTDSITVTVNGGCTMGQDNAGTSTNPVDRTFAATITNGTAVTLTGSGSTPAPALEVLCNTTEQTTAFHITANPANNGSLVSSNSSITPGTAESGNTSAFMYKPVGNEENWAAVPTAATEVASKTASDTPFAFNPSYRVYVSLGQASGTYQGSIAYTLAMGAH